MAHSELSIARSTLASGLVSLFLESLFFGAFAVVYGITAWILLIRDRHQGRSNWDLMLFIASTVMFVFALVHMALDVHINIKAFLLESHDFEAMAHLFDLYNGLVDPIGAVKFAIYVTQTLIGDGFMIYRAYVVWNRSWYVIIIPSLLLFGEVVLGYVTSCLGKFDVSDTTITACVNAFFILSVVTNVTSTALIMKRILWSPGSQSTSNSTAPGQPVRGLRSQRPRQPRKTVQWRVVESLVQSAAIYSLASVSLAVTSFLSPAIGFPACHSVFPSIIGLVFVLIVIRISLNAGAPDAHRTTLRHSVAEGASCTSLSLPTQDAPWPQRVQPPLPGAAMLGGRPIAIKVSVSTTSDGSSDASSYRTSLSTTFDPYSPGFAKEARDVEKTELESPMHVEGQDLSPVLHISDRHEASDAA
ncbi:uncharacterized protein TRAVEDRAFT_73260 [Trametes versicolor FP-101664 SS1]|uniref:uncharacterized protein n=1 Tax=Trametes versicolor (strain FP-101664) TaxID=717944 RepID=UPI00046222AA|nr:uncharacterized protein TRAVEDRAFT_73260 [Trametes versicolor FP-101664 SS1]EIW56936.1 hypothetical protein TRAVEDRAFT_73260 [Trametes versicolor FP-101664 SS1]